MPIPEEFTSGEYASLYTADNWKVLAATLPETAPSGLLAHVFTSYCYQQLSQTYQPGELNTEAILSSDPYDYKRFRKAINDPEGTYLQELTQHFLDAFYNQAVPVQDQPPSEGVAVTIDDYVVEETFDPTNGEYYLGVNWLLAGATDGCVVEELRIARTGWRKDGSPIQREFSFWLAWPVQGGKVLTPEVHDNWVIPGNKAPVGQLDFSAHIYWAPGVTPDHLGFQYSDEGARWEANSPSATDSLQYVRTRERHLTWDNNIQTKNRKPDPELPREKPEPKYDVTKGQVRTTRAWATSENVRNRQFYHGTNVAAGKKIESQGFKDMPAVNGRRQGNGIYLTLKEDEAQNYADYTGSVVVAQYTGPRPILKVHMVNNGYGVESMHARTSSKRSADDLKIMKTEDQLVSFALENGFGALYLTPAKHLIVPDPRDLTVLGVLNLQDLK
ncbi:hypothetical protein ACIQMR_36940 [Streptomyces sp. NPDC091376]|uniref:hypothetical protein n=1 Tax=Streptomyces sp. NPDC091376 TaxID=3365994 RepID=UPI0037F5C06A